MPLTPATISFRGEKACGHPSTNLVQDGHTGLWIHKSRWLACVILRSLVRSCPADEELQTQVQVHTEEATDESQIWDVYYQFLCSKILATRRSDLLATKSNDDKPLPRTVSSSSNLSGFADCAVRQAENPPAKAVVPLCQ